MIALVAALALSAAPPTNVFRDANTCNEARLLGARLERADNVVRVVTWNIRWFPDGRTGTGGDGVNLDWLGCALWWLDADVVVLQEIKRTPSAIAAMDRVLSYLSRRPNGTWQVVTDDCPHPDFQHLAFLHRMDRITLEHITTRGEIDPTTQPRGTPTCPGRLRPALTAYVKSRRGGLDFHLAGVHLDSGDKQRDQDDRLQAWQRLGALSAAMQTAVADDDIIVLGDFNTMGCGACSARTGAAELAMMTDALRVQSFPFRIASSALACTEYYRERGALLDHVIIAATMQEADDAQVRVRGICGELACKKLDPVHGAAMRQLSDHCPVVVDIPDVEIDGR